MREIAISKGKVALVDDEDFAKLSQFNWYATARQNNKDFFATRRAKREDENKRTVSMHRMLMNPPRNMQIDHIDRNQLNNQKSNLRICTASQNCQNRKMKSSNTSGYKGVNWSQSKGRVGGWIARIGFNRRRINLGLFKSKEEAYEAYLKASKKYHGAFRCLK